MNNHLSLILFLTLSSASLQADDCYKRSLNLSTTESLGAKPTYSSYTNPNADFVIVSNRLPYSVKEVGTPHEVVNMSDGGLVSAITGVSSPIQWKGAMPGMGPEDLKRFNGLDVPESDYDAYYNGFSNQALWFGMHGLDDITHGGEALQDSFSSYTRVNKAFVEDLAKSTPPEGTVFVQDYHLTHTPMALKELRGDLNVGYFHHIPMPEPGSRGFESIPKPMRKSVFEGISGGDIAGFHTREDALNFIENLKRSSDVEVDWLGGDSYKIGGREVLVREYPIGIDPVSWADRLPSPRVRAERDAFKKRFSGQRVVLGVDRLDPSKGLLEKVDAFEEMLKNNPKMRGNTVLYQLAIPSRLDIPEYADLKLKLEKRIEDINKRYALNYAGKEGPIVYRFGRMDKDELTAAYAESDVMFVSSKKDGMNLVSFEYAAVQNGEGGALVLSRDAGAAKYLTGAHLIDPNDVGGTSAVLRRALEEDDQIKAARARENLGFVKKNTANNWFLEFNNDLKKLDAPKINPRLRPGQKNAMIKDFGEADERYIFLDYDGTLRGFTDRPEDAIPDEDILDLLKGLSRDPKNNVFIVSGRKGSELEEWFKDVPNIGLVSDHGTMIRNIGSSKWDNMVEIPSETSNLLRGNVDELKERFPGSLIEEKTNGFAFHFRTAESPEAAEEAFRALQKEWEDAGLMNGVRVQEGSMVFEILPAGANKGEALRQILKDRPKNSFAMAIGDDLTDNHMFEALNQTDWPLKVGDSFATHARARLTNVTDVHIKLREISEQTPFPIGGVRPGWDGKVNPRYLEEIIQRADLDWENAESIKGFLSREKGLEVTSTTDTKIVSLRNESDEVDFKFVLKGPDTDPSSLIKDSVAEVAAYDIARLLNVDHVVPPTGLRMREGKPYSLQYYSDEINGNGMDILTGARQVDPKAKRDAELFMYIAGKWDRAPDNILLDKADGILLPDNASIKSVLQSKNGEYPFIRYLPTVEGNSSKYFDNPSVEEVTSYLKGLVDEKYHPAIMKNFTDFDVVPDKKFTIKVEEGNVWVKAEVNVYPPLEVKEITHSQKMRLERMKREYLRSQVTEDFPMENLILIEERANEILAGVKEGTIKVVDE